MPRKKPRKKPASKPAPKPGRAKPSSKSKSRTVAKSKDSKTAVRFWVPPSVKASAGGGAVAKGKNAGKPEPKFWTPEQLGFVEKAGFTEWDRDVNGISYSRETDEPVGLGGKYTAKVIWYGRPLTGLVVLDYPGHTKRISVHVAGVQRVEDATGRSLPDDPLAGPYPAGGWCHTCSKPDCGGVTWALALLQSRLPKIPF